MPASPGCASSRSMSWRVASAFGRIARNRFGRSNERTKTRGARTNSLSAISARVGLSAVAVTAIIWTSGSASATSRRRRYSGRKSWPHCETQCASSMARRSTLSLLRCGDRVVAQQPFGRDVEKSQRTLLEAARDPPAFVGIGGGIEARRLDPGLAQLGDLVAHERDQRRNHQSEAAADDRRELEAEATCRCRSA